MDDVFVGQLMSRPVHTVTPDATIQVAAGTMIEHDVGSVVVVDDGGRLEGILTSTDVVRTSADGDAPHETTVAASASTDVTTTTVNVPIADVADTMVERGFHHLPVVDDDERVIGMITTTDLAAYLSHVRAPSPDRSVNSFPS